MKGWNGKNRPAVTEQDRRKGLMGHVGQGVLTAHDGSEGIKPRRGTGR